MYLLYTTAGSSEPCDARAPPVAGEWRIVEGGMPGDVLEIHATGVVMEAFDGHTLVFPLMVWRAEITEPVMFP